MPYRIIKGPVSTAASPAEHKKALAGEPYERAEYAEGKIAEWLPKEAVSLWLAEGVIEEVKTHEIQGK